jgi:hypothetical protein
MCDCCQSLAPVHSPACKPRFNSRLSLETTMRRRTLHLSGDLGLVVRKSLPRGGLVALLCRYTP